jgi:hypothetical protein
VLDRRVDQSRDDAHQVIRLPRPGDGCGTGGRKARDGVPGLIIGVPALALERQKDGHGVMLKLAESLASPMQFSLWQV